MKYIVYAYNYLTLFKSLIYADKVWGNENTIVIYTPFISSPPRGIENSKCKVWVCTLQDNNCYSRGKIGYLADIFNEKAVAKSIFQCIIRLVSNDKFNFIVFRDRLIEDTLLIKMVKRRYPNTNIILLEEGLGLYASSSIKISNRFKIIAKMIIHILLGVPLFPLLDYPIGSYPLVDEIICRKPELIKERKELSHKKLVKEMEVFKRTNCQYLINEIAKISIPKMEYNYVFLSQPLFPKNNENDNHKYEEWLKLILSIASEKGKVLIKPHPRDKWKYTEYTSKRINICDSELTDCPFECIVGYYGNPQTITIYSSAGCSVDTGKPNIFLYDMFPNIVPNDLFESDFIRNNNIIRCTSIQEFRNALV